MKAIRVHQHGGPDALALDEVPVPEPGPGQAVVRVEAAGVNFIDSYHRIGLYQVPLPFTLGQEAAGVVERVAPDVTVVKPGDRVASAQAVGAYAPYALVLADRLVPVPAAVTTRDAAAVILQGLTAQYLTTSTHALQYGETCLVHAAAGGVGGLLVQMARLKGARVIATVGSEAKAALARQDGADEVILYRTQDVAAEVKRLTSGALCRVVYDGVGRDTFHASLACTAPRGLLVTYGNASGAVPAIEPLVLSNGSKFLTRPKLADYIATREELLGRARDLFDWMAKGKLKVRIHREYPLAEAAQAHRDLESRKTTGKLLLIP